MRIKNRSYMIENMKCDKIKDIIKFSVKNIKNYFALIFKNLFYSLIYHYQKKFKVDQQI